jgi:hypothetical protein
MRDIAFDFQNSQFDLLRQRNAATQRHRKDAAEGAMLREIERGLANMIAASPDVYAAFNFGPADVPEAAAMLARWIAGRAAR